ncbi:227_t:CDS:2, partial [Scutellospora calospora]
MPPPKEFSEYSEDLVEKKTEEHNAGIKRNNMILNRSTPLEVFKQNKDKSRKIKSHTNVILFRILLKKEDAKKWKSPEESFNFGQRNRSEDEFKRKWDDDIDLCTTELIFHRGLEKEFRNMIWDLKYNKGEYTKEELTEVVKELNKGKDGEIIIKNNQVYWRRDFSEFKKRYLRDYPRCKELSDYKQE